MVIQNNDKKIKFCDDTLHIMKRYIQQEIRSSEAGGILIGRENAGNENLIIEFVTEPLPQDRRSRCRFLRKDLGHIEFFEKLYKENDGVYGYIGEWHTHPENIPHYSFIDSNNWKKIGRKMINGKQYHVIVGIQEIGIWEYDAASKKITKIDSVNWKRILKNETVV